MPDNGGAVSNDWIYWLYEQILIGSLYRQGTQGIMDTASKGTLEDEFGTHKEEDVVKQIIERGSIVESEVCLPFGYTMRRS